jgi:hypothetical protein
MQPIAERDLRLYIHSRVVRRLVIAQVDSGAYQLHARLTVQPDQVALFGVRGLPREWASLDRLAKHIQNKFGLLPVLELALFRQELRPSA